MAVAQPHAGIQSVEELKARGAHFVCEVAAWAKTKIKVRGERAVLSQIEITAMAWALELVVDDHPDFPVPPGGAATPAAPQDQAGTEL